jgi:arylsulfatase A-like enzyme
VDVHRDHYEEAIEYLDSELARFVRALAGNPKMRNSLLIITSDHGESFERGLFIHGEDLYESSVHVPLIIKYPRQDRGAISTVPVQSIDIAPTILGVIGVPIPTWMEGRPVTLDTNFEERETIMTNYKDWITGKFTTSRQS